MVKEPISFTRPFLGTLHFKLISDLKQGVYERTGSGRIPADDNNDYLKLKVKLVKLYRMLHRNFCSVTITVIFFGNFYDFFKSTYYVKS